MYKQKTYKEILENIKTEIYKKQHIRNSARHINKLLIELRDKYNIIAHKDFLNNLIFENNIYAKLLYEREKIKRFLTENNYTNAKIEIMEIYAHNRIKNINCIIAKLKHDLDKSIFMYKNKLNKINRIMQYVNKINTYDLCEIKAYGNKDTLRKTYKQNYTYRNIPYIRFLDIRENNKNLIALWTDNKLINKKSIHKDSITELSNKTNEQIKDIREYADLEKQISEIFN